MCSFYHGRMWYLGNGMSSHGIWSCVIYSSYRIGRRRLSISCLSHLSANPARWWLHPHHRSYRTARRRRSCTRRIHGLALCGFRAYQEWGALEDGRARAGEVLWDHTIRGNFMVCRSFAFFLLAKYKGTFLFLFFFACLVMKLGGVTGCSRCR